MSRVPGAFHEAGEGVVADGAVRIEDLDEPVATRIVERQHAVVAEVEIRARYPYERTTPVTGLSTQEMVTLIGIIAASRTTVTRPPVTVTSLPNSVFSVSIVRISQVCRCQTRPMPRSTW